MDRPPIFTESSLRHVPLATIVDLLNACYYHGVESESKEFNGTDEDIERVTREFGMVLIWRPDMRPVRVAEIWLGGKTEECGCGRRKSVQAKRCLKCFSKTKWGNKGGRKRTAPRNEPGNGAPDSRVGVVKMGQTG